MNRYIYLSCGFSTKVHSYGERTRKINPLDSTQWIYYLLCHLKLSWQHVLLQTGEKFHLALRLRDKLTMYCYYIILCYYWQYIITRFWGQVRDTVNSKQKFHSVQRLLRSVCNCDIKMRLSCSNCSLRNRLLRCTCIKVSKITALRRTFQNTTMILYISCGKLDYTRKFIELQASYLQENKTVTIIITIIKFNSI
jgi:hypothetical protein